MKFFGPPPPPPEPAFEARAMVRHPWFGPPEAALPGVVPIELVLARTDDTVIAMTGVRAYPTGFSFTLYVRLRNDPEESELGFQYADPLHHPPFMKNRLPDELLRFGVRFADGGTATTLDRHPYDRRPDDTTDPDRAPDPPVLLTLGGGGDARTWDVEFWVWPLPPAGPLTFAAEWPARNIPETLVEVDSEPIRAAAARAVQLWPEGAVS